MELASEVMARAERGGARLVIPVDVVVADAFSADAQSRTVDVENVPDGWRIMDIGHKTLDTFRAVVASGKTILWNGPMGVFEMPAFSRGTREFAAALGSLDGVTTVLGGGLHRGGGARAWHRRPYHARFDGRRSVAGVPGGQDTARRGRVCWTRRRRTMIDFPHIAEVCQPTSSKLVMLVVDGLGGAPHPETGRSELEEANIPNLNALAARSACGLTLPVLPGITPGSGPGHLSLFGYDPIKYIIGRGVLEALGIDADIREGDVAARGNFCTVDAQGKLVDRRAGRISSQESVPLCEQLDQIEVPGLEVHILPVQDYRFVALFRGEGLSEDVTETDPQILDVPPRRVEPLNSAAQKTAEAANAFIEGAREVLGDRDRANMVLLRGFSQLPHLPQFGDSYRLNPAAIAAYPMYRGLSTVVGMTVIPTGVHLRRRGGYAGGALRGARLLLHPLQARRRGRRGRQLRGQGSGAGGGGRLHPAHPGPGAGRAGGGR